MKNKKMVNFDDVMKILLQIQIDECDMDKLREYISSEGYELEEEDLQELFCYMDFLEDNADVDDIDWKYDVMEQTALEIVKCACERMLMRNN